jgi:uncharacterized tellurite resistance protein B-like protein
VFHAQRWDYVFTLKRQGQAPQRRQLSLWFKDNRLERFDGDEVPTEQAFVESLQVQRKNAPSPTLAATPEQLKAFEISDEGKAKVYSAVFHFKEEHRAEVLTTLHSLDDSDLRFTLIADLFLLALSNGYISVEELEYVEKIGEQLGISKDQVMTIKDVQFHLWKLRSTPSDSDAFKAMLKECASNLAAAGVPIAAVAGSGSVFGLSAAGITSGLAALGGLIGGGMLAGTVLVVPALAVGSAWGVKKLVDLVTDNK